MSKRREKNSKEKRKREQLKKRNKEELKKKKKREGLDSTTLASLIRLFFKKKRNYLIQYWVGEKWIAAPCNSYISSPSFRFKACNHHLEVGEQHLMRLAPFG